MSLFSLFLDVVGFSDSGCLWSYTISVVFFLCFLFVCYFMQNLKMSVCLVSLHLEDVGFCDN